MRHEHFSVTRGGIATVGLCLPVVGEAVTERPRQAFIGNDSKSLPQSSGIVPYGNSPPQGARVILHPRRSDVKTCPCPPGSACPLSASLVRPWPASCESRRSDARVPPSHLVVHNVPCRLWTNSEGRQDGFLSINKGHLASSFNNYIRRKSLVCAEIGGGAGAGSGESAGAVSIGRVYTTSRPQNTWGTTVGTPMAQSRRSSSVSWSRSASAAGEHTVRSWK